MYTTGQFRKKVGIENNTMIRWLREGVIVPEPTEGRNNLYSPEEVVVGRIIAPLYFDWSIKAEILSNIAGFLRDYLSVRKELGYDDPAVFWRDLLTWKYSVTYDIAKNRLGEKATQDALDGYRDAYLDIAKELGVTLPDGWDTGVYTQPEMDERTAQRVENYRNLIEIVHGRGPDWDLFLALNDLGEHYWWLCTYKQFREKYGAGATTFMVVNLKEALAD